jgi:hypothetical protein
MDIPPPIRRVKSEKSSTAAAVQRARHSESDNEKKERTGLLKRRGEVLETVTLERLIATGEKLRRLPVNQLKTLNAWTMLSDVVAGEVFEVEKCTTTDTTFGPMALLECHTGEGKKQICAPERYADSSLYPSLMVYLGKCESTGRGNAKPGQRYHCLRQCGRLEDYGGREEMRKKARELRAMTVDELRAAVEVRSLRDFAAGTVFVYSSPRLQSVGFRGSGNSESTDAWVVNFSTQRGEEMVVGEVFVPERYSSRLEREPRGIMVFRGVEVAKMSGREFYNLEFLSQTEAELLVA